MRTPEIRSRPCWLTMDDKDCGDATDAKDDGDGTLPAPSGQQRLAD